MDRNCAGHELALCKFSTCRVTQLENLVISHHETPPLISHLSAFRICDTISPLLRIQEMCESEESSKNFDAAFLMSAGEAVPEFRD